MGFALHQYSQISIPMRTPMNAIIGTAQLAERSLDQPEKLRQYMANITGAAKHLLSLINDVLDMSKIESGKMVLVEDDFSLTEALERIDEIIRPLCNTKKQRFEVENKGIVHPLVRGADIIAMIWLAPTPKKKIRCACIIRFSSHSILS